MLIVVGTVPVEGLPLKRGLTKLQGRDILIGDLSVHGGQGTASMIGAATEVCEVLSLEAPYSVIAGDIGEGDGSRILYEFLMEDFHMLSPKVLTLHYILPIITPMREFMQILKKREDKPLLIADAGAMYAAKSAGVAEKFDLFTPDPGEMAFLADPDAMHPAYVRNFISHVDTSEIPKLMRQAYDHGNSSRVLLVKGATDYVAKNGEIIAKIDEPNIPTLEPIGGTGDTITGTVSALVNAGYDLVEAAIYAAKINRVAGLLTDPNPATKISEIIHHIPEALKDVIGQTFPFSGV